MEKYNKLVRDKIPEKLDRDGIPYEKRIAEDYEYAVELFKKLNEEVGEFNETPNVEELADIIEVIEAIKKLPEFSNVDQVRLQKLEEKGGFEHRIILKGEKYK